MLAALLLDFAFRQMQERAPDIADPWVDATFRMVESRLSATAVPEHAAALRELSRQVRADVQLLDAADISTAATAAPQVLLGDGGRTYYLKHSTPLRAAIRIGPLDPMPAGGSARFMPALFYLSILAVVGLWLRPLLADLSLLTAASQKFAADYREPLATADQAKQLTSLAGNLDDMSGRLSHLIQSQKELTAALSHEMRTPLARIRFALAVIGNQANEPIQKQLNEINADVTQIDALIASLLEYARLDHPDLRMDWQEVALEPWFAHALAASGTPNRTIQLSGVDSLARAWLEPRLMELALSNLVANACRFARSRVLVTFSVPDNRYRLMVEDDGDGIAPDKRGEIFKAYRRLDSTRNHGSGGFGLGLAIVARVAALHGGSATVGDSEVLGGARFVIEWPQRATR
jgi:signal transduction histidine kinase